MKYNLNFHRNWTTVGKSGEEFSLHEAVPTDSFWKDWRVAKADMKAEGYSVLRDKHDRWVVRYCAPSGSHQERVETLVALKSQITAKLAEKAVPSFAPTTARFVGPDEDPPWDDCSCSRCRNKARMS